MDTDDLQYFILKENKKNDVAVDLETAKINVAEDEVGALKRVLDLLTAETDRDIEAIKKASKEYKDAAKGLEVAKDNLAKRIEKHRRDMLEKIGCKPDNHPANHTALDHLRIKGMMHLDIALKNGLKDMESATE